MHAYNFFRDKDPTESVESLRTQIPIRIHNNGCYYSRTFLFVQYIPKIVLAVLKLQWTSQVECLLTILTILYLFSSSYRWSGLPSLPSMHQKRRWQLMARKDSPRPSRRPKRPCRGQSRSYYHWLDHAVPESLDRKGGKSCQKDGIFFPIFLSNESEFFYNNFIRTPFKGLV
jgi:hypothetical protein